MYSSSNIIIFIEVVRVCKEFHPTFVIKYKNLFNVNNIYYIQFTKAVYTNFTKKLLNKTNKKN